VEGRDKGNDARRLVIGPRVCGGCGTEDLVAARPIVAQRLPSNLCDDFMHNLAALYIAPREACSVILNTMLWIILALQILHRTQHLTHLTHLTAFGQSVR
jgi:hypothetical protein